MTDDTAELLKAAVAEFEAPFAVRQGFAAYISQTNEPYVVVCSGGVRSEGDELPLVCRTPAVAIQSWLEAAKAYADNKAGTTLYWRSLPELGCVTLYEESVVHDGLRRGKWYAVYSRLLMTDQPEVLKQDGNEFVPIDGETA